MKRPLLFVLAGLAVAGALSFATVRVVSAHHDAAPGEVLAESASEPEGEHDGGPQDPPDYLTLKWTSGEEVTAAQVARAFHQARTVPRAPAGSGSSSARPTSAGGSSTSSSTRPGRTRSTPPVSGGGIWKSTDAGARGGRSGPTT